MQTPSSSSGSSPACYQQQHRVVCGGQATSPSQQQQRGCNGVQVASMRCVLCGGPFRCPTPYDNVAACLTGPPSSFRWLSCWRSMPADADKRKRGEPAAFFTHRDCYQLIQHKLNIQPRHSHLWPFIKQHMAPSDSMPDSLPAGAYLGLSELLDPYGTRTSTTMLSPSFKTADSWMLHSPLVCTRNATRILTIWQPKLDITKDSLLTRLASLMLQPSTPKKWGSARSSPKASGGGALPVDTASAATATTAQPDIWDVLLSNSSMHEPQVVAKLHLTSRNMSARLAAALSGRLHLTFSSCSTESVLSLALWLDQHAALLASLQLSISVCCCCQDEADADAAIASSLANTAMSAPNMRLRAFSTTCSKPQLLSCRHTALPCLQHLTHVTVPDLPSEQQVRCLPPTLCSMEITKSTADAARLQLISQQCPKLREVRLGYNLWPSKAKSGSFLLDHALNGWVLLPVVELRFIGCRLPRGFTAKSSAEPPYMSRAALGQLANLSKLTRLMFSGCCVDAPISEFTAALSKVRSLRALDLAEPSGVLTAEHGRVPRYFVDSTATLLQATSRKGGGGSKPVSGV